MTQQTNSWLRFLPVVALLAGAGLFLHARSDSEALPSREPLASFPKQVGEWVGRDFGIPPDVLEVLGAGEFLTRVYQRAPGEPHVDLFLAYFPSQRTGSTIHSPQNCLPGAGWTPLEAGLLRLARPDGESFTVNRYVIGKGIDRQVVLYWYQAHRRAVASEYWAKIYLVTDAIRLNRTDGALVRVITPVARQESIDAAQQRAVEFARQILPLLDNHIPQ